MVKETQMTRFTKFDVAEHLNDAETIAAYLTEAFESNDAAFISLAIGTVARAKGMAQVAGEAGLSRARLYNSLNGQDKPEFDTGRQGLATVGVPRVAGPSTATKAI